MTRPFGIQLLAAVLTFYAMSGVLLAAAVVANRAGIVGWDRLAMAGGLFAVVSGNAAMAVWRMERRATWWLGGCGALGLTLCILLPLSAPPHLGEARRDLWEAALTGGALLVLFLALAAYYVRRRVRSR